MQRIWKKGKNEDLGQNSCNGKEAFNKKDEQKIQLFGKSNKIDKFLSRLFKKKRTVPTKQYEERNCNWQH